MAPVRLLIASIGNPAPYLSTLHSAGHTVLFALASTLGTPLRQTSGRDWAHGLLSPGTPWTLWASPAPMNASGAAVARAWRTFTAAGGGAAEEPRLVVLHDELEASLGALRVRPGSASAKGHNGLRSIGEALPGVSYTRIGIGIGRPESREPGVVAGYVLRKMSGLERGRIEGVVGDVVGELRRLRGE
jgi:PTH1 family peptidyl-tRNA hydrolase